MHFELVAGYDFVVDNTGGIVIGILACTVGVGQYRRAQQVIRMQVGTAYALVTHIAHREISLPLHLHADAQENGDDTGVLANRAVAERAHARIDQRLDFLCSCDKGSTLETCPATRKASAKAICSSCGVTARRVKR